MSQQIIDALPGLIERVRQARSDVTEIEVKSAAGGMPATMKSSICALANLAGGGWVVLGLEEANNFKPVILANPQILAQALSQIAMTCVPRIAIESEIIEFEERQIVVAKIEECDTSVKPCRDGVQGKAWIRGYDGDYRMDDTQVQAFIGLRTASMLDRKIVEGSVREDLDDELIAVWSNTVTEFNRNGLGRFTPENRLIHAAVIGENSIPTKAGLLTLGRYPQQFFPRYIVNMAKISIQGDRLEENQVASGPIPVMMEEAMDWARRNFAHASQFENGSLIERWEYPLEAFREIISNALIHRDLSPWSQSMAVEIRLYPDHLVVISPGGLFGITKERLGQPSVTSSRNSFLIEMCRYARSATGGKVVEGLSTGIPRVISFLMENGNPPPEFYDSGLQFTVILRNRKFDLLKLTGSVIGASLATGVITGAKLGPSSQSIYNILSATGLTVNEINLQTGKKAPAIRWILRSLQERGLVKAVGGRGQRTVYVRS
jgi:ATP-dependent DNA helicase RecG